MVEINRVWLNVDTDTNKITLFGRPRVESFPFPAPFEEQRYIGDEGKIHAYSWDGRQETNLVGPYSERDLYLDHFGKL